VHTRKSRFLILYLLRHGHAQPKSGIGFDEERALTPEGRAKVSKVLTLAKENLGVEIERILSSNFRRTIETSEIAKGILRPKKPKIIASKSLGPDSSPFEAFMFISEQDFRPQDRVLLVSHQPLVGEILSNLLGTGEAIGFAPGSMARVDVGERLEPNSGALIWLISSDVV
jgi:phosphohistidine phosphatase